MAMGPSLSPLASVVEAVLREIFPDDFSHLHSDIAEKISPADAEHIVSRFHNFIADTRAVEKLCLSLSKALKDEKEVSAAGQAASVPAGLKVKELEKVVDRKQAKIDSLLDRISLLKQSHEEDFSATDYEIQHLQAQVSAWENLVCHALNYGFSEQIKRKGKLLLSSSEVWNTKDNVDDYVTLSDGEEWKCMYLREKNENYHLKSLLRENEKTIRSLSESIGDVVKERKRQDSSIKSLQSEIARIQSNRNCCEPVSESQTVTVATEKLPSLEKALQASREDVSKWRCLYEYETGENERIGNELVEYKKRVLILEKQIAAKQARQGAEATNLYVMADSQGRRDNIVEDGAASTRMASTVQNCNNLWEEVSKWKSLFEYERDQNENILNINFEKRKTILSLEKKLKEEIQRNDDLCNNIDAFKEKMLRLQEADSKVQADECKVHTIEQDSIEMYDDQKMLVHRPEESIVKSRNEKCQLKSTGNELQVSQVTQLNDKLRFPRHLKSKNQGSQTCFDAPSMSGETSSRDYDKNAAVLAEYFKTELAHLTTEHQKELEALSATIKILRSKLEKGLSTPQSHRIKELKEELDEVVSERNEMSKVYISQIKELSEERDRLEKEIGRLRKDLRTQVRAASEEKETILNEKAELAEKLKREISAVKNACDLRIQEQHAADHKLHEERVLELLVFMRDTNRNEQLKLQQKIDNLETAMRAAQKNHEKEIQEYEAIFEKMKASHCNEIKEGFENNTDKERGCIKSAKLMTNKSIELPDSDSSTVSSPKPLKCSGQQIRRRHSSVSGPVRSKMLDKSPKANSHFNLCSCLDRSPPLKGKCSPITDERTSSGLPILSEHENVAIEKVKVQNFDETSQVRHSSSCFGMEDKYEKEDMDKTCMIWAVNILSSNMVSGAILSALDTIYDMHRTNLSGHTVLFEENSCMQVCSKAHCGEVVTVNSKYASQPQASLLSAVLEREHCDFASTSNETCITALKSELAEAIKASRVLAVNALSVEAIAVGVCAAVDSVGNLVTSAHKHREHTTIEGLRSKLREISEDSEVRMEALKHSYERELFDVREIFQDSQARLHELEASIEIQKKSCDNQLSAATSSVQHSEACISAGKELEVYLNREEMYTAALCALQPLVDVNITCHNIDIIQLDINTLNVEVAAKIGMVKQLDAFSECIAAREKVINSQAVLLRTIQPLFGIDIEEKSLFDELTSIQETLSNNVNSIQSSLADYSNLCRRMEELSEMVSSRDSTIDQLNRLNTLLKDKLVEVSEHNCDRMSPARNRRENNKKKKRGGKSGSAQY